VWKYFIRDEEDPRAKCTLCNKCFSQGGKDKKHFNTTNLRKHLKSCHKDEHDALTKEEELVKEEESKVNKKRQLDNFFPKQQKKTCTSPNVKSNEIQMTLSETIARKQSWDINSDQSQAIHTLIGEMIASDC